MLNALILVAYVVILVLFIKIVKTLREKQIATYVGKLQDSIAMVDEIFILLKYNKISPESTNVTIGTTSYCIAERPLQIRKGRYSINIVPEEEKLLLMKLEEILKDVARSEESVGDSIIIDPALRNLHETYNQRYHQLRIMLWQKSM